MPRTDYNIAIQAVNHPVPTLADQVLYLSQIQKTESLENRHLDWDKHLALVQLSSAVSVSCLPFLDQKTMFLIPR